MSVIVDFYIHDGIDFKGRLLKDMWEFSYFDMETHHDYIQWMFPLHEGSMFNKWSPVVDNADREIFLNSKKAKNNFNISLNKFSDFLGIIDGNKNRIDNWAKDSNHNLLRITRAIRSSRIFGLEEESKEFFNKCTFFAKESNISDNTIVFWKKALERPVFESLRN